MRDYILYDDEGIIFDGTLSCCIDNIVNWCSTDIAKDLYSKTELRNISSSFKSIQFIYRFECLSVSGFTIKEKKF